MQSLPTFSVPSLASIKNAADEIRAQVYPRNETEKKVYEALSSKNWGASTTLMTDIATDTMDFEKFGIVMAIIWQNVEGDGKTWKHMFKTLTLIEFLIKNGSERVIEATRDRLHKIRSLQDFNYYEGTVDKGSGVREKAKQIVELLGNNEYIRAEREKARVLKNKFVGISNDGRSAGIGGGSSYGGSSYSGYEGGSSYSGSGIDSRREGGGGFDKGGSGNSYSDSYNSSPSRYGGGAYDSNRPSRYGDDVAEESQSYTSSVSKKPVSTRAVVHEDDDDDDTRSKPTKGGKLKVSIKKASGAGGPKTSALPVPTAAPEVDLFGSSDTDFMSAPTPAAAPAAPFDPFGSSNSFPSFSASPAPAPQTQDFGFGGFPSAPAPAPSPNVFATFPSAAPVPQQQFDPFAPQTFPPTAPIQQHQQQQFGAFVAPQQGFPSSLLVPITPMNPAFAPSPAPMQSFGNQSGMNQLYTQPQTFASQSFAPPSAPSQSPTARPTDDDFGGFEGAAPNPSPAVAPAPVKPNTWGDMGNLCDLSGIAKNEDKAAKQASTQSYAQSSFAGLDGFSKQPSTMGSSTPSLSMQQMQQPQVQPMAVRQVGGMGAPMPMGGPSTGLGAGPMGGMPMAGPGYMQQQPGFAQGGYGAPTMGGIPSYPQQGMTGGAPSMGMGMAPQQFPPQGQPMGMQPPQGMYPNMQMGAYGAPQGYQSRAPGGW